MPRTPQRNNYFSTGASFWPCFFFFINRKEKAKAAAQVSALPALPTLSSDCGHGREMKGEVIGYASVRTGREAGTSINCLFYALILMFLLKFCFVPASARRGVPALGMHPGTPPMAPALAGTHADGVRDRAFCVSRHWTFPFAGGELAHRGTCPTLVLYLFKEITPPNQSILTLQQQQSGLHRPGGSQ